MLKIYGGGQLEMLEVPYLIKNKRTQEHMYIIVLYSA